MNTIRDLLQRDLSQRIEEVVQLDQTDEGSVYTEITEYVATDRIREHYRLILRAFAEMPRDPHEGVGVWVSGFFGSGKSSFAKNLGYVLANPPVLGQPAAELFRRQLADPNLDDLIAFINRAIPTEVIMFDVQKERAVRGESGQQKLAEVMYTVLLRHLGYAEDFDIAELEIELEAEGRLEEFVQRCEAMHGQPWRLIRKGAQKLSRASAILHHMDPVTYPAPDSWARSLAGKRADITVTRFVDRTFELMARRRPGKGLVFIIDEVGQYVGRSTEKIEDLRAVVEEFGKQGKNRLRRREIVAPVWVVVTSQEKLDEVVSALDSRRVELAKLQDRFRYRVDLAPADIREVASRRVLAKKPEAEVLLRELFRKGQGQLNVACRLERTTRATAITEDEFVQFYPYLPHFMDLSIDIMSGIRLQPGAPRHLGGSNRTIIKQAFEMLVSERTRMAESAIGALVTLDRIYELVEGNLPSERQKDVSDIQRRFEGDAEDGGWAVRVAKALSLLEFVRDVPRTEANIAAVLVDQVGQPAPLAQVQAALRRLEDSQFVRHTDEGWKLQTAQEKHWDTERRSFLDPKPSARNEIKREVLRQIFEEPRVQRYRYRDLASFRPGLTVDGVRVSDGRIPLALLVAEDPSEMPRKVEEARELSRQQANQNTVYWVFSLNPEIDHLIANLYASQQMISKYNQLKGQHRITAQEQASLDNEKNEAHRYELRLREKMGEAVAQGTGLFRGVTRDGSDLGKDVAEVIHRLLDTVIPDLYPKLELGIRPLKGTEAEEILRAATLGGLSQVFYEGNHGYGLVRPEGAQFVINPDAPVAKEVLDYLRNRHAYGERVTGAMLEERFRNPGYGWDGDVLRLVMATLLRAGAVEFTYKGQRIRTYQDPQARAVVSGAAAFREASFAPRESLDRRTLTTAVRHWEELTGKEVNVEEHAVAAELRSFAAQERNELTPLLATAQARRLPVADDLRTYQEMLSLIMGSDDEDCVRFLAGQGKSLHALRDKVKHIRAGFDGGALDLIDRARVAADQLWPVLMRQGGQDELASRAQHLGFLLQSPSLLDELDQVAATTAAIEAAYRTLYEDLHRKRAEAFRQAIEDLNSLPEWGSVGEEMRASLLQPLLSRACEHADLEVGAATCSRCGSTVGQMESDLAAVPGLRSQVVARLQELTRPAEVLERVRPAAFFPPTIESEDAVHAGVERLRDHLLKRLAEGYKIVLE